MKFKICLILIFLFFFLSGFIKVKALEDSSIIKEIELSMQGDFSFQENGVKATYKTNLKKDDEINAVKDNLQKKLNKSIVVNNDEISIWTSFGKININFFYEDNKTIVDLNIINYNKEITISKLLKELTELQGKNGFDIQYFQYIKGKIYSNENTLSQIQNLHQMRNMNTLDIHNGYVGLAHLNNGERVNISINSYDTGNYLIIGTPVIFTTY